MTETKKTHNTPTPELRAKFEATVKAQPGAERAKAADALMNEAVRNLDFLIADCDYPELRDEAGRIYNGHAALRRAYENAMVTGTEVKEIAAAARLLHLADEGPVAYGRDLTERTELCARILCEFRGMDYDQIASFVKDVPEQDGAGDLVGYRKELAKTRHKPMAPGSA